MVGFGYCWAPVKTPHPRTKCVTYFLNKIIFPKIDAFNVPAACEDTCEQFSGAVSTESRRFAGRTLQWPLDAGNRDTCQLPTSGCPSFSPGTLPRGKMAYSQFSGMWMRSDTHLTSTQDESENKVWGIKGKLQNAQQMLLGLSSKAHVPSSWWMTLAREVNSSGWYCLGFWKVRTEQTLRPQQEWPNEASGTFKINSMSSAYGTSIARGKQG